MTSYNLKEIAEFTNGVLSGNGQLKITDISFDSRKLVAPRNSIFFAFKSQRNDGHDFIKAAFDKGVRAFVVHTDYSSDLQASFIRVADSPSRFAMNIFPMSSVFSIVKRLSCLVREVSSFDFKNIQVPTAKIRKTRR